MFFWLLSFGYSRDVTNQSMMAGLNKALESSSGGPGVHDLCMLASTCEA